MIYQGTDVSFNEIYYNPCFTGRFVNGRNDGGNYGDKASKHVFPNGCSSGVRRSHTQWDKVKKCFSNVTDSFVVFVSSP